MRGDRETNLKVYPPAVIDMPGDKRCRHRRARCCARYRCAHCCTRHRHAHHYALLYVIVVALSVVLYRQYSRASSRTPPYSQSLPLET
jgi:hypothetical protein